MIFLLIIFNKIIIIILYLPAVFFFFINEGAISHKVYITELFCVAHTRVNLHYLARLKSRKEHYTSLIVREMALLLNWKGSLNVLYI